VACTLLTQTQTSTPTRKAGFGSAPPQLGSTETGGLQASPGQAQAQADAAAPSFVAALGGALGGVIAFAAVAAVVARRVLERQRRRRLARAEAVVVDFTPAHFARPVSALPAAFR